MNYTPHYFNTTLPHLLSKYNNNEFIKISMKWTKTKHITFNASNQYIEYESSLDGYRYDNNILFIGINLDTSTLGTVQHSTLPHYDITKKRFIVFNEPVPIRAFNFQDIKIRCTVPPNKNLDTFIVPQATILLMKINYKEWNADVIDVTLPKEIKPYEELEIYYGNTGIVNSVIKKNGSYILRFSIIHH